MSSKHPIQQHIDLQPFNTFRLKAKAEQFMQVRSLSQCQALLQDRACQQHNLFILGGGSNILLTKNIDALVLKMEIKGIKKQKETQEHVWLNVGAGETWHDVVTYCVENRYQGIENLALIPGTIGAAPMQNIGAYGVELKDTFATLNAIARKNGALHAFNKSDCQFGYRDSVFKNALKNQFIIVDVTIKLNKPCAYQFNTDYAALQQALPKSDVDLQQIYETVMRIRQEKLPNPNHIPNAGSFFKNPIISNAQLNDLLSQYQHMPHFSVDENYSKVPAAWLIEQCGLKGKRLGNVSTYSKQALVIINDQQASGSEIADFAQHIMDTVQKRFSIQLMPEVNII